MYNGYNTVYVTNNNLLLIGVYYIHTLICSVIRLILVIHAPGPFFVFGKKKTPKPSRLVYIDKTRLSLARRRVLRCNNGQLCRRCECVLKCVQLVNI